MARKKNVVLYFTEEAHLSDEQAEEMSRIPGACHRNAAFIDPDAPLEKCDGVAGDAVPEAYAEAYPTAKPLTPADDDDEADDPNGMTVQQLKDALDEAGVDYPASAKKAALVALYEQNIETE